MNASAAVAAVEDEQLHQDDADEASPSSRALAWAWEVVLRHGQPGGDHLVRVPLTQRQLAEAGGCSAGTVSWYLRCLGPAVRNSSGGVVFDRRALAQMEADAPPAEISPRCAAVAGQLLGAFGRPGGSGGRIDLVVTHEGRARPASLADMGRHLGLNRSSTHRHLQALERAGHFGRQGRQHFAVAEEHISAAAAAAASAVSVAADDLNDVITSPASADQRALVLLEQLTELVGGLTRLAEAVLSPHARPQGAQSARDVPAQVAPGDQLRASPVASRAPGSSVVDLIEREISSHQSPDANSPRATPDPVRAEPSRTAGDWGAENLPELLAPLLDECQRLGLPGVTDPRRLADSLAPYSSTQVAAAAQRMTADLAGGAPMRSPVAILVRKARDGDVYYFPPERPATVPTPPPVVEVVETHATEVAAAGVDETFRVAHADQEAADAVAALSAEELVALDELVQQSLPRAARGRSQVYGLELYRRIVWRERHPARGGV